MKNKINFNEGNIYPSKVVCVGRNYVEHIHELGNELPEEMVVFVKPNSAITTQLCSYHQEESLHYESEICFLYAKGSFIAVGFGLDLTKRTLQHKLKSKGLPWERAKAFDGSAVLSDFVPINDISSSICLTLEVNGELIQAGGVASMIYKPQQILDEICSFMTLEDGDVVMTGTPKGVGEVKSGNTYTGTLRNNSDVILSESWIAN